MVKIFNNDLHTFVVLAYKENEHLEDCVKSVLSQKYQSKILIATTTPNKYISDIAKKYNIELKSTKHTNIGGDFDFAKNIADTQLVTIAHQDDIYEPDYSNNVVKYFKNFPSASIFFTDYYEIRNGKRVDTTKNLKIKKLLLSPLCMNKISNIIFLKRLAIRFGDAICCPSVSFNNQIVPRELFKSKYEANVDWFAWEKLSRDSGYFIYINKKLMGHRISESSETTKIINSGKRTNEDYEIFVKFWPAPLAKILASVYKAGEKSNEI